MKEKIEDITHADFKDLSNEGALKALDKMLSSYRRWVEKRFELEEAFLEEAEYLSFHRGEIHKIVEELQRRKIRFAFNDIRDVDSVWQDWILKKTSPGFSLEHPRDNQPKSHWWEWIDKLDELSEEDKTTL